MAITASIVVATIAVVGMQVALAASPVPVVVSFTATKTTIPDTGARIVLKASIKYASSCEITVSPSLPGFPKSFSCSSDRVMQSVTLRANKTGNPITYSFGMAVKNSTGSITATNVAVTEDAALPIPVPVVVSFTATKTTIPDTGARIVLKASIKYASSCEITVSPSLPGFPKSFSCSSDRVMQSVTLRANKTGKPITYTFGMAVKNSTGSITATNVAVTEGVGSPPISFTPPPPGNPTTVVFAPEGVFVADNPLIVTVTNNSSATQDIASAAISTVADSADFGLTMNNCANVTPHASCSLAIQFRPSGAGIRTGAVSVVDASWGASGTTIQLNLSGTGVWATATVSSAYIHDNALIFPTSQVLLTQSPIQPVTLTNVGTVPLYISPYSPPSTPPTGIAITGGDVTDFTATLDTCSNQINAADPLIVSVGQSCTFEVGFEPSGTGTRTSYVVLADNTLGGETQLQLKGVGIAKPA
jgi:signal peptidase I